jgi:hypothetical protein
MQPTWTPPAAAAEALSTEHVGVSGWRGVIEFSPSLISTERLCAGVVLQLQSGQTAHRSAIDAQDAERVFGQAGAALADVAERLCHSLAQQWAGTTPGESPVEWVPPFSRARLASEQRFTAASVDSALDWALNMYSAFYPLLAGTRAAAAPRHRSLLDQVRRHLRLSQQSSHLARHFSRFLEMGERAAPLRVDFLGRHTACYLMQVTESERQLEINLTQAYGKLYELDAVRRFVGSRPATLGLLADERPQHFELMLVGDATHNVRRRVLAQIEAVADQHQVLARPMPDAKSAAERLMQLEAA